MNAELLIPIGICVVLPVLIVWLVTRARQNETNRKAEIMLKAIEAGVPVDMKQFEGARKTPKTIKQDLLGNFTGGCICTLMGIAFLVMGSLNLVTYGSYFMPMAGGVLLAVGIGLLISYFVGKKSLAKEIEAEEKQLNQ